MSTPNTIPWFAPPPDSLSGSRAVSGGRSVVDRLVVVVANLAPRQIKFGLSEGMVAAASGAGAQGVYLLSPDSGAPPRMRLH